MELELGCYDNLSNINMESQGIELHEPPVEPVVTGNWTISLSKLVKYIKMILQHSVTCGASVQFIGERRLGLGSDLKFQCGKCSIVIQLVTSTYLVDT